MSVTAQDSHLENLATKTDIAEVRGDLKLMKWMLAIVIAAEVLPLLKEWLG